MDAKTFYDKFLRPYGFTLDKAEYLTSKLEAFRSAAFAAGREAMRTDAESAVFSLMARNAHYDGEFYTGDYADNMREAARAIRALPGKEG